MVIIDVPPNPYLATCPECGMERPLPEGWQDILRESVPPDEPWDGNLRCQNEHPPQVMTIEDSRSR